MTGDTIDRLLTLIRPDPEGVAVVSLAAQKAGDGSQDLLARGSVLMGPASMGDASWLEWAEADTRRRTSVDMGVYGIDTAQWRQWDHSEDGWRFCRFILPVSEVGLWLTRVLQDGLATVPTGADISCQLGQAESLIQLFPGARSSTSSLAAMAGRPLLGWHHPQKAEDPPTPPSEWGAQPGRHRFDASLLLHGMSSSSYGSDPPVSGLLIARLRRRAWISDMQGQPGLTSFGVDIRLDPERISVWELVLDVEEADSSGHVLSARRVRLADVQVPGHGADHVTVPVPAMGAGLSRWVRLYDLDGRLLDAADDVRLLERIEVAFTVNGEAAGNVAVGSHEVPTLVRRLGALEASEAEHARVLAEGTASRIVRDQASGRAEVAGRLAAARGELLIYDPYFGAAPSDWDLLRQVRVPVRLLTWTHKAAHAAAAPPLVEVRGWSRKHSPPFHDRGYLWRGGGLSVGTSPNGLGGRLALIDVMEPSVAAAMADQFELWWAHPDVVAAPWPAIVRPAPQGQGKSK